jgi:hypothetical protein
MTRILLLLTAVSTACGPPVDESTLRNPVEGCFSAESWVTTFTLDGLVEHVVSYHFGPPTYAEYHPSTGATCSPSYDFHWFGSDANIALRVPAPLDADSTHALGRSVLDVGLESGARRLHGGTVYVELIGPGRTLLRFEGGEWCDLGTDACEDAPEILVEQRGLPTSAGLDRHCDQTAQVGS